MIGNFKNIWNFNFMKIVCIPFSVSTSTNDVWVWMTSANSILYTLCIHMPYVGWWCKLMVLVPVECLTCGSFSVQFHGKKGDSLTCKASTIQQESTRNRWYYYNRHMHCSTILIDMIHSYNSLPHVDNWIKLRNCQFFDIFSILQCYSPHTAVHILILIWLIQHIILTVYMWFVLALIDAWCRSCMWKSMNENWKMAESIIVLSKSHTEESDPMIQIVCSTYVTPYTIHICPHHCLIVCRWWDRLSRNKLGTYTCPSAH